MIQRLVRYRSILTKFKSLGLSRVFSDNLGDAAGISAALVRKDFSIAKLTVGNKRGGYSVDGLLAAINEILGTTILHKVIIVGCGKVGTALMHYGGFSTDRIAVAAGFDNDPKRIDPKAAPVPILPMEDLPDFLKKHPDIQIAILAVPDAVAADTYKTLAEAGIQGILNFSTLQFKPDDEVAIQNISISFEIEHLFYYVRFNQQRKAAGGTPVRKQEKTS